MLARGHKVSVRNRPTSSRSSAITSSSPRFNPWARQSHWGEVRCGRSQLVELLTSTIFPGPVYSSYGNLVATRQYEPAGFTTALGFKDLRAALDAADSVDLDLPFGGVLRGVLAQALANGQGEMDWASIAELVRSGQSGEGSPETPTR